MSARQRRSSKHPSDSHILPCRASVYGSLGLSRGTAMPRKRCLSCGFFLVFEMFHKHSGRKSGLNDNCKTCVRSKQKEWQKNPRTTETRKRTARAYQGRLPAEVKKARRAVYNAVIAGKMPRAKQLKCTECGQQASSYHHHKGYAKEVALDVIPLCGICHCKADSKSSPVTRKDPC